MEFIIVGKNIDVTPGLRGAVEDKLSKLDKYFSDDTKIHVTLSVEKERQKIEVTIPVKGNIIRSEQVSNDMYVSIDLVEEIIERQLKKYRNKLVTKKQTAAYFNDDFSDEDKEVLKGLFEHKSLFAKLFRKSTAQIQQQMAINQMASRGKDNTL